VNISTTGEFLLAFAKNIKYVRPLNQTKLNPFKSYGAMFYVKEQIVANRPTLKTYCDMDSVNHCNGEQTMRRRIYVDLSSLHSSLSSRLLSSLHQ
jgi:hypothetical protein